MTNVDVDIDGVWPFNYCMTEVQAALGAKLIDRLDELNKQRRNRANRFIEALSGYAELVFQKTETNRTNVYHLLPARYDGKIYGRNNDNLIDLLSSKYGIKAVVQYYPLNRYPLFVKMGFAEADCPNADKFFDNMISFPFHDSLKDSELDQIVSSTRKVLTQITVE